MASNRRTHWHKHARRHWQYHFLSCSSQLKILNMVCTPPKIEGHPPSGCFWHLPLNREVIIFYRHFLVFDGNLLVFTEKFCQALISFFSQSVSLTQYVVLFACLFQLAYCLNNQAHYDWFTSGVPQGQLGGRRWPSIEDNLQWKTTFDGRRTWMN